MDSLQFQISSTNADSKSDNEYVYYIPSNSILGDSQEHIYLSIQSAIIPNSFYNINKYNNTLIYSMDSNNIKQSFSLPLGNYNIKEVVNYFNSNFLGFTTTLDKQTNKLSFQNTSYLNFKFYSESTIYNVIGFSNGLIYHSEGGYLASRNCINLNSIQYINVKINISTNNITKYNFNDKNIICSIPVNVSPNGVLNYMNGNDFKINTFKNNITEIIIGFTDQNGNTIDFNGVQWSMVLQMDFIDFVK